MSFCAQSHCTNVPGRFDPANPKRPILLKELSKGTLPPPPDAFFAEAHAFRAMPGVRLMFSDPEYVRAQCAIFHCAAVWDKFPDYDETNTLLIDDSEYKAERNPRHTSIHPQKYEADMHGDDELSEHGMLFQYLRRLSEAVAVGVDVPTFVERNPYEYPADGPGSRCGAGEARPEHSLPKTAFLFDDPATIFIETDGETTGRGDDEDGSAKIQAADDVLQANDGNWSD